MSCVCDSAWPLVLVLGIGGAIGFAAGWVAKAVVDFDDAVSRL